MIEREINKLNLETNSKTNIYRLSNGISFLGYTFNINKRNKLIIRYNNKTIRRINRKLKNLYTYDYEKYLQSKVSYKGYLKMTNTEFDWDFKYTK